MNGKMATKCFQCDNITSNGFCSPDCCQKERDENQAKRDAKHEYDTKLEKQIVDLCYNHILHNYAEPYYFFEHNDGMVSVKHGEIFAYTVVEYMIDNNLTTLYRLDLHDVETDDGIHHYWLTLN